MKPLYVFSPLKWILSFVVLFYSCTDQKQVVPILNQSLTSSSKPIQEFSVSIDGAIYRGIIEKDSLIQLKVPYSDVRSIQPTIKLAEGFSVGNSTQSFDLTKQIKYKIMDSKGASKTYLISTLIPSSPLSILGLSVNDQIGTSFIDTAQRKITVKVKQSADLSKITIASLSSSPKTTISPAITQPINFNSPVKFTVKGIYGESKDWMVTVIKDAVLSSAKDIIQFEIQQQPTTNLPLEVFINNAAHRIEVKYFNGANITEIKVSKFAMSPNATLKETIPSTIDLAGSSPVFSVQAQDGSVQVWTMVGVNKGLSNKTNSVKLSYDNYLKKGFSFFHHVVVYDFKGEFTTDKSYIKVLDMQAIAFGSVIGGGPGAPAAFANFQNFKSGSNQDGSYTNGTQFVKVSPSVTFATYEQFKEGFESSSEKLSAIGQYNIKYGDLYIAKVRGADYYVLIQITQVVKRSDFDFDFTFTYKY